MRLLALALLLAFPVQEGRDVEKLLRLAEERHRAAPDPSDVRAAAERLGRDRARIAAFVRDEIAFEPYGGILRDARGTLLTRAGNGLDRALLLGALLEASGEKIRLVQATLSDADGGRLRDAVKPPPPEKARDLAELARLLGADPKDVEAGGKADGALAAEALRLAEPAAAAVREAIGPREERPLAVPREHFWVQVEKPGGWEDVDPSPIAVEKKDPRPVEAKELAARRRSVRFGLVLHRRVDGKAEALPLLSVPFDLSAVAWQPIHFVLLPAGEKPAGRDAESRAKAIRAARVFRAGLRVAGRMHGAAPFDLEGKTYAVGKGGELGAVREIARGLGNLLEKFDEKKAPVIGMDRLDLEVAIREPGAPERVLRRTLLTPSKPLRPLGVVRASFLVDAGLLPAGERHRRDLGVVVRNAAGLRAALAGKRGHVDPDGEVSSLLLRYADLRRRVAGGGPRFLQPSPGVVAATRQLWVDDATGELSVREGIDLFENPGTCGNRTMLVGAAETALEHLMLEGGGGSAWPQLEQGRLSGAKPRIAEGANGRLNVSWSDRAWWSVDPATGSCVGRVTGGGGQAVIEYAYNAADEACAYSGFFDIYSKSPVGSKKSRDLAGMVDNACDILQGQWPVEILKDKILELQEQLWRMVIEALAGMGA